MTAPADTKRHCPQCGTPTFDVTQRFCSSCGALLSTTATPPPSAAAGGSPRQGQPSGLDGMVNQYIQDRMRDSSSVIAQQVKQELKTHVRRTAETQLRRNGGKIALYAGIGVAGLIVISAVLSLITGLIMQLLPFALVAILAYVGYLAVTGRLRRS